MKRLWPLVFVIGSNACSSESNSQLTSDSGKRSAERGEESPSGAAADSDSAGGVPSNGNGTATAGVLTAGAWDDNKNFDFFEAYRKSLANMPGTLPLTDAEHEAAHAAAVLTPHQTLDVSLVIDTTGSMGDEIAYLQKEFDALSSAIQVKYPNADQRWSLVLYRDEGDEYVVKPFDFQGAAAFTGQLAAAGPDGGGDFPEAPDQGIAAADKLGWRASADTAKLLFWVADAPHHDAKAGALADAIRGARDKSVHVYPIASSGVDELTELTMRSAAQLTGGRYLFLTDDSGVGGEHKEPTVPCYYVTKLDRAIGRMVDIEMTGVYREPAAEDILRTGGNPQSGVCTLASGTTVTIY